MLFLKLIFLFQSEISFKIILLGDFGVGKSSIIQRYVEAKFTDENPVTLGTEFKTKIVETSSKKRVKLIIWDSAGQEVIKHKKHQAGNDFFFSINSVLELSLQVFIVVQVELF